MPCSWNWPWRTILNDLMAAPSSSSVTLFGGIDPIQAQWGQAPGGGEI